VRERDAGDREDRVHHLRIRVAGRLEGIHHRLRHRAAGARHCTHERRQRVQFRVAARRAAACCEDPVRVEPGQLAHQRMRGQAVVATVHFADGQLDHLDLFFRQARVGQFRIEVQQGLEGHGAVAADRVVRVRHFAQFRFDGGEEFGGTAGGGGPQGIQTAHDLSFRCGLVWKEV
ncbi:conserved hypothetical protein, partial [Ricinus communis]